jgi:hypothetical protein
MLLQTDLSPTADGRKLMLDRALSDRTRCVVIGNSFDNFDYSAAKNGINEFVDQSFQRITSIISNTMEPANGSANKTA